MKTVGDFQQGEGVRSPSTVTAGGTITVDVGPNDDTVEVTNGSTGTTKNNEVAPGKTASIPIPNVPGGTILYISVGKGPRARSIIVEVISSSP